MRGTCKPFPSRFLHPQEKWTLIFLIARHILSGVEKDRLVSVSPAIAYIGDSDWRSASPATWIVHYGIGLTIRTRTNELDLDGRRNLMRRSFFSTSMLVVGLLAISSPAFTEPMQCRTGSIAKTYGGTEWTVSSCDDGRSLVVVSAPGNPAMPFVFYVSYQNGKYSLRGEGNGSKQASSAAFEDLSKLVKSDDAIDSLISETVNANEESLQ